MIFHFDFILAHSVSIWVIQVYFCLFYVILVQSSTLFKNHYDTNTFATKK